MQINIWHNKHHRNIPTTSINHEMKLQSQNNSQNKKKMVYLLGYKEGFSHQQSTIPGDCVYFIPILDPLYTFRAKPRHQNPALATVKTTSCIFDLYCDRKI